MGTVRYWLPVATFFWCRRTYACLAGLLLLVAALGKLYGSFDEPLAAWAFPLGRMGYALVTAWEILLGIWLLGAFRVGLALGASLITHVGFVGYHVWGSKLATSCGCFGILQVPESLAAAAAGLGAGISFMGLVTPAQKRTVDTQLGPLGISVAIGLPLFGALAVFWASGRVDLRRDGVVLTDRVAWLEPSRWLGSRFPLLPFIEGRLPKTDTYVVALLRRQCQRCRAFLERLRRSRPHGELLLLFVDGLPGGERLPFDAAQLQPRWEWSVDTPVLLLIRDGIVQQIGDERVLDRVYSNQAQSGSGGGGEQVA